MNTRIMLQPTCKIFLSRGIEWGDVETLINRHPNNHGNFLKCLYDEYQKVEVDKSRPPIDIVIMRLEEFGLTKEDHRLSEPFLSEEFFSEWSSENLFDHQELLLCSPLDGVHFHMQRLKGIIPNLDCPVGSDVLVGSSSFLDIYERQSIFISRGPLSGVFKPGCSSNIDFCALNQLSEPPSEKSLIALRLTDK